MSTKKMAVRVVYQAYDKIHLLTAFLFIMLTAYSLHDLRLTNDMGDLAKDSTIMEPNAANNLAQIDLFGTPVQVSIDTNAQFSQEIEKLHLKGIFFSTDMNKARAIINSSEGETKTYKQGDVLFSDISLAQLFPDKIILKRNNQTETIYLVPPRS